MADGFIAGFEPPALSVIICTHARPAYLEACLEGLSRQQGVRLLRDTHALIGDPCPDPPSALPALEVVVVDSASPHAAQASIARLAAASGARLVRTSTPGLSLARNLGLKAASAAWTAWLDDDAVPEPDWAQRLLAAIETLPDEAVAIGGRILPEWEAPLPAWWPDSLRGVLTIVEWDGQGEATGGAALPGGAAIYGANMAFRRDALRAVGGFPEDLGRVGDRLLSGEEEEVLMRLESRGGRVFYDGSVTVRHSIQAGRLRPAWLVSRLHWQGATDALRDRRRGWPKRAPGAAAKLVVQAPLLAWPSRSATLVRARCGAAYNLGYLRGTLSGRQDT
ncbi:glycosyltransferase family 2 protein [Roseomonas stagni]|uniref:Glycosyltransferase family 2 protein n=1 Tax=Falsiroseomonas algicola TaxID=2716930 RepID=A0A6M1LJK6_9PROT|nr:glycosyltransferase family A protein [Falsiroseomonas algicola]NGM20471.1 glycosyltransferase family 2 protein [Falsiroseomonas algicola]